jgi:hypothetical protein
LVGEVVVPILRSSSLLWGRDEGGQMVHLDGAVQRAMIASGYCQHMPPLGALNRNEQLLPRDLRFTLGGDEHPFRVFGWAEHRPNREIEVDLLEPFYRESGWRVEWGPEFMSEKDGYVRTFRLTNEPAPITEGGDVYFAVVKIRNGEYEKVARRLVQAESEQEAGRKAILEECHHDSGEGMSWEGDNAWDGHGEWFYSVQRLIRVDPADVNTLRKYFAG